MKAGYSIEPYSDAWKDKLVSVWERSVRETHSFLKPGDFEYYKSIVPNIDFNHFDVYGCFTDDNRLAGFIGVSRRKIEMLFNDPDFFGQGIGKMLILLSMEKLGADEVEVNEGNTEARGFYEHFG